MSHMISQTFHSHKQETEAWNFFINRYWWFNLFSWFSVVPRWRSLMCWSDWKVKLFVFVCRSDMIGQRTRAPKSSEGKMVSGKRRCGCAPKDRPHWRKSWVRVQIPGLFNLKLALYLISGCLSFNSPVSLKTRLSRRSMTCWRVTWDSRPRARWEPYRKRPARL